MLVGWWLSSVAQAALICPDRLPVDPACDYFSIADAFLLAPSGETLLLRSGTYNENVELVDKALILEAEDPSVPPNWGNPSLAPLPKPNVSLDRGTLTLRHINLSGDSRPTVVAFSGSELTLESCLVSGGATALGGGVSLEDAVATISSSTFLANTAESRGGALSAARSRLTVTDSYFGFNSALYGGGAMEIAEGSTVTLNGNTFELNEALDGNGGALLVSNSSVTVNNSTFNYQLAERGAAIYGSGSRLDLRLAFSHFYLGVAEVDGGAVVAKEGALSIEGGSFQDNLAAASFGVGSGGAIWAWNLRSLEVLDTVIERNIAQIGGGLYVEQVSQNLVMDLDLSRIQENRADTGGGLYLAGNRDDSLVFDVTVSNSTLQGNRARSGGWLAGYANNLDLLMQGNLVIDNGFDPFDPYRFSGHGGAVYLAADGDVDISNNRFCRNQAGWGGVVTLDGASGDLSARVHHNALLANVALSGGSVMSTSWAEVQFDQNTAYDNATLLASPYEPNSLLYDWGSDLTLYNNLYVDQPGPVFVGTDREDDLSYEAFWPDYPPAGVRAAVWADPLLTHLDLSDACASDLRPLPTSPTINAGRPDLFDADGSRSDIGLYGGVGAPGLDPLDRDADGVLDELDCEPLDDRIFPGAAEICDGLDNDCDGFTDGPVVTVWADEDEDGFGSGEDLLLDSCRTEGGYATRDGDCDDEDPTVYPGADEDCDGTDSDCDGTSEGLVERYADLDRDGFGGELEPVLDCDLGPRWVEAGGDCDDLNGGIYPGAPEACDGVDADCDGDFNDPDASGQVTVWADADRDGFGDANRPGETCTPEAGKVTNDQDCDDTNPDIFPGSPEVFYDEVDQDCDGRSDFDADLDGFDAFEFGGEDCDDRDPDAVPLPGAPPCDVLEDTLWMTGAGCGCTHPAGASPPWALSGLLLLLLRRRR